MLAFLVAFLAAGLLVKAFISYANDFVDPDYIISGNFPPTTGGAQETITQWALEFASKGPWTVMNKTVIPPSGDMHDYMSWAPYSWPNCTGVGNTTELLPQQIWKECPYETRDGMFNPDGRLINDVGAFSDLADAVLYNSISHTFQDQPTSIYSQNVVNFLKVWFLNNDTRMNPNLNYAQMKRGPDGQLGEHTGILDLKCFTKIASGILILRQGVSVDYTSEIDSQMLEWSGEYITWLESAAIALEEARSANNHGSFYYNQLAALKIIVNDLPGARNVTDTYFKTLYPSQIEASGEQPLEAARTRPYHYRAYNLAAMITNARLAEYAVPSSPVWNSTSSTGGTIKTALDFAMGISANSSGENSYSAELYPNIAAVASIYGDEGGRYASFLNAADSGYAEQPYFLWNQPLAGGTVTAADSGTPNKGFRMPLARIGWLELAIGVVVGLVRI